MWGVWKGLNVIFIYLVFYLLLENWFRSLFSVFFNVLDFGVKNDVDWLIDIVVLYLWVFFCVVVVVVVVIGLIFFFLDLICIWYVFLKLFNFIMY